MVDVVRFVSTQQIYTQLGHGTLRSRLVLKILYVFEWQHPSGLGQRTSIHRLKWTNPSISRIFELSSSVFSHRSILAFLFSVAVNNLATALPNSFNSLRPQDSHLCRTRGRSHYRTLSTSVLNGTLPQSLNKYHVTTTKPNLQADPSSIFAPFCHQKCSDARKLAIRWCAVRRCE
jgi:hypothetical protein